MTNEELQALTEAISASLFGKPFRHKAYFNPRLRTTGGRYLLKNHHIEVNRKYLDSHGIAELEGIIKHELCHYHLHLEGKGYKHGDADFRRLLGETGAPRHCTPLLESAPPGQINWRYYQCQDCGQHYKRRRRVNLDRYSCGICRGKLKETAGE